MVQPDLIIAKSIGTVVAIHAFHRKALECKGFVFIGVPVRSLNQEHKRILVDLCGSEIPVLFIQQSEDPLGSFADLQAIIRESKSVDLAQVGGNDHQYSDLDELRKPIENWHTKVWAD